MYPHILYVFIAVVSSQSSSNLPRELGFPHISFMRTISSLEDLDYLSCLEEQLVARTM